MIDIDKQVAYWQSGAEEDWDVAQDLINRNKTRHGLFFAHLALEKLLKAQVCRHSQDLAPRIHNLTRLAELTALKLDESQIDILAEMNVFNLEGRYPDTSMVVLSKKEAQVYLRRAEKVYVWLKSQL